MAHSVLVFQGNETAYVFEQAMKGTTYNLDMALNDYYLLSTLKKDLQGWIFANANELKAAVESHFKLLA